MVLTLDGVAFLSVLISWAGAERGGECKQGTRVTLPHGSVRHGYGDAASPALAETTWAFPLVAIAAFFSLPV
ncbi:hypothetical protein JIQ42_05615 [Leishmania sp. Namibia]|uniref:hypothetical protein n=1 Tax=Leishmania sp. Namibia TaxID=2802991 RepID=UPI001B6A8B59|nr:hypothetical protein JIQ42_05615 [Leishmania sp. Namibia]